MIWSPTQKTRKALSWLEIRLPFLGPWPEKKKQPALKSNWKQKQQALPG
mgnify:FL=1